MATVRALKLTFKDGKILHFIAKGGIDEEVVSAEIVSIPDLGKYFNSVAIEEELEATDRG